jgi:hypothetical protein
MDEPINLPDQNSSQTSPFTFGKKITVKEAGFSFQPIEGFELEVDGSVYMYSEDGHLEICMIGGELDPKTDLARFSNELASDFMINFDEYQLVNASKDFIQGSPCLVNEIYFTHADENGQGRTLICSPHTNQFFFLLVIASAEYWLERGMEIFSAIKDQVQFHPEFAPVSKPEVIKKHSDLTIETFETVQSNENLVLSTHRGAISLLLAARTFLIQDEITLIEIIGHKNEVLYRFDSDPGELTSRFYTQPILSSHGELCLLLPLPHQQTLPTGNYRLTFATKSASPLQEVKVIFRQGRVFDLETIDLNLWLASEDERFNHSEFLVELESQLRTALKTQLAPLKLIPGKILTYHPAPDELLAFSSINLNTDLADCSYMIAESVEVGRALNVGLVDRLTRDDPTGEIEIKSVSSGAPGMILSPTSPHACILVNFSVVKEDFYALADAIIEQMLIFCGLPQQPASADQPWSLSPDLLRQLRRHPLFYNTA